MIIAVATVFVLLVAVVVLVVTIGGGGPRGNIVSRDSKGLLATGVRQYPLGATAAAVTGYYSERGGASGLERAEEEVLGSGNAVQATVDLRVQQAAYDAMTKADYTGAVVALKPQTGEILAMVSTPSYDPNLLSSHNFGEQDKAWQQLTDPKTPPHAWYVAFAPADNPQTAVAVIVESGGDRKFPGTGGSAAAPISRATINAAVGR